MRAMPSPSWRDSENPPLTLAEGGSGAGGGATTLAFPGAIVASPGGAIGSPGGAITVVLVGTIVTSLVGAILASAVGAILSSRVGAIAPALASAIGRLRSKSTTMR